MNFLLSITDCLILKDNKFLLQFVISPHFIDKKKIYLKEVIFKLKS